MSNNTTNILDILNNIFLNKDKDIDKPQLNKKKNPMESIVEYYVYLYKDEKTAIPFKNFINIISVLPLIKRSNGKIIKCNDCGFYVYSNNYKYDIMLEKGVKIPPFYGFMNENYLINHITNFINEYRPNYRSERLSNKIKKKSSIEYAIFSYYHSKHSKSCVSQNHDYYIVISDYNSKLLDIYRKMYNDKKIDHIKQIHNYIHFIIGMISQKNADDIINRIIQKSDKILQKIGNRTFMPVYASVTYFMLKENNILNKNEDIVMRKVSNIFCISPTSIYMFIKQYPHFFSDL